jgi:SAM-dependent methyltransferase
MPTPPPPQTLARYVGERAHEDPVSSYLEGGAAYAAHLLRALPDDVELRGGRVLDFGCGSGRILRHMVEADTGASFEGCDIHPPSVEWLAPHVAAPHGVFLSGAAPPLPRPDGHFRMIYAASVFTHLWRNWAAWLLEMHRLLEDGGVLLVTHIGRGYAKTFGEHPWDEDRIGMLVLGPFNDWEEGGPMVLHSEWWMRAHWGRCFDVLSVEPDGFGNAPGEAETQGLVVLRKLPVAATVPALEAFEPGERRELTALEHAVSRSRAEVAEALSIRREVAASKVMRATRPMRRLWYGMQSLRR